MGFNSAFKGLIILSEMQPTVWNSEIYTTNFSYQSCREIQKANEPVYSYLK
jgi:hypothetical protein